MCTRQNGVGSEVYLKICLGWNSNITSIIDLIIELLMFFFDDMLPK